MAEFFKKTVGKVGRIFMQLFSNMRIAQKLMLIYSIVLGITIITFAGQLISVANHSTQVAFLKDTQKLLKESKFDIENKIDICYRVISSLSGDYDVMSYIKGWDKGDKTSIFDFSQSLNKKIEQTRYLSPDVYQFRFFTSNGNFPEIGSFVYNDRRLQDVAALYEELAVSPNGYWQLNHVENNFNTTTINRIKVISLYTLLRYSTGRNLGIVEVSMPVGTFFRHMYSQSDNKNLLAYVIDDESKIIYDPKSEFARRYSLDENALKQLQGGFDIRGKSGSTPISIDKVGMNMVYDYVEELNCSICYVVTNENITGSLKSTTILIIAESLLSLLVLSVLIYFLMRIIFKKMKKIIASMRKVGEGKFDFHVDISGQDEMSEMAYHFNRMLNKLGNLITEVINKQEAKKNAEIHALFSQINSHFIINTLENIRMMAEVDCKFEIADGITSLGRLLRYGLKWTSEFAMLKEEIEYIRNYIDLLNMRYDFVVVMDVNIPPELMDYKVLKVSLQPIIENAVHYGIEPLGRDGFITVQASAHPEYMEIEITDNGTGMDEERLNAVRQGIESETAVEIQHKRGNGIGLRNVNERLRLVFGKEYGISIVSKKDEYTKVSMRLPAVQ
jgi:two-component system sensor histidine kinase YesM